MKVQTVQNILKYKHSGYTIQKCVSLIMSVQIETCGCSYHAVGSMKTTCLLDLVGTRRNPGVHLDLYHTGTPPRFTVFFSEVNNFPTCTDLQAKCNTSTALRKKTKNPTLPLQHLVISGATNIVTGYNSSLFLVVDTGELKIQCP